MPSAAILCGGRASRFGGSDKSALVVAGRSILDRQIDVLAQLTTDVLLVRGKTEAAPQTAPKGLRIVVDRVSDKGPLGGLDAALAAARDHTVIVVACDMPFVDAALLRYLASLAPGYDA